jgi:hypothetical protein
MALKNKKALLAIMLAGGLALTGCAKENNIATEEEVNSFLEYMYEEINGDDDIDFHEAQVRFQDIITRTDNKTLASEALNTYLYVLYLEVETYTEYLDIIGSDLTKFKEENELEIVSTADYEKVSEKYKKTGAILEEMHDRDLLLYDDNNIFSIEVDIQKMLDTYREYLDENTIEFLEFRITEYEEEVYDANTDSYDLETIVKRALTSVDKVYADSESVQLNNWKTTAIFYYDILMGGYTTTALESDDETITEEYIEELRTIVEGYPDTRIYKDLIEYLHLLEINDRKLTSTDVLSHINDVLYEIDIFGLSESEVEDLYDTVIEEIDEEIYYDELVNHDGDYE